MQFNLTKKNNNSNSNNKNIIINNLKLTYPNKMYYNSIIPLKIFQTWHTKNLPPKISEAVNLIKTSNPRFEHHLYDDNDCREYIKENFPEDVLKAYNSLIPGAYKADLWRYCILYKEGGIYVDLAYCPYNGFKFINLTEKEHFVFDLPSDNTGVNGIYNALMVCLPGNEKLLKAINQIVENVANKYYGNCFLEPTGPLLLEKYFSKNEKMNLELKHEWTDRSTHSNKVIKMKNYIILKSYNEYGQERDKYSIKEHYGDLWKKNKIYI
jgi:mannosyltransferase OCH1-like enzyme